MVTDFPYIQMDTHALNQLRDFKNLEKLISFQNLFLKGQMES